MKKKIYLIIAIPIIILSLAFSAWYFIQKNTISDSNPLVITDTDNKQVTLTKYPEKVISLIPAATETIYDLNAQNKLIAVDTYSNYPEATKDLPKVETNSSLNIESIVNQKPDVVFMSKMGQTEDQYNNLVNAGVKVVMVDATSIEETYTMIELIGKVLGKEKEAVKITTQMKKDFADIANSVKGKQPKSVYYEISPLQYGLWTCGNNTFEDEILKMLNLNNVFENTTGWSQISEEQVIKANPDYIITTTTDYGDFNAVNEIMNRPNWNNVQAIKAKQVYSVNPDIMSRPTKRLVDGAKELEKLIYGE